MSDTDTLSERLIREIIEGCEGVTPGPWENQGVTEEGEERGCSFIVGGNLGGLVAAALCWPSEHEDGDFSRVERNAEHITRLDPATVRAAFTELLVNRTALDAANATIERQREALTEIAESPRIPLSEAELSPVVFAALNGRVVRAREALEPARQAQEPTS